MRGCFQYDLAMSLLAAGWQVSLRQAVRCLQLTGHRHHHQISISTVVSVLKAIL